MNTITRSILIFALVLLGSPVLAEEIPFKPGLMYPNGIEPGDAKKGEAPAGNKNIYVFSEAPDGGNGSYKKPYNNFRKAVGFLAGRRYSQGELRGGDYLYVRGTFTGDKKITLFRKSQGGVSWDKPTVIKSWPGFPRAVFDGEYKQADLIWITQSGKGIRLDNIEVKRALVRGIAIREAAAFVEIANVVVRDCEADGNVGIGGALFFGVHAAECRIIVRNSYIHGNIYKPKGFQGNQGAISINGGGGKNGNFRIYNNIIENEIIAVRHKHGGHYKMEVFHNVITDSQIGFWVRSTRNNIHHNVFRNVKEVIHLLRENQFADIAIDFHHNTVVDSETLFLSQWAQLMKVKSAVSVNVYRNIFATKKFNKNKPALILGVHKSWDKGDFFALKNWRSSHNIFYTPKGKGEFLRHGSIRKSFQEAMPYLKDTTSVYLNSHLKSKVKGDFRLLPKLKQSTKNGDKDYVGAFPPTRFRDSSK